MSMHGWYKDEVRVRDGTLLRKLLLSAVSDFSPPMQAGETPQPWSSKISPSEAPRSQKNVQIGLNSALCGGPYFGDGGGILEAYNRRVPPCSLLKLVA